jgi:hypothetical protein
MGWKSLVSFYHHYPGWNARAYLHHDVHLETHLKRHNVKTGLLQTYMNNLNCIAVLPFTDGYRQKYQCTLQWQQLVVCDTFLV